LPAAGTNRPINPSYAHTTISGHLCFPAVAQGVQKQGLRRQARFDNLKPLQLAYMLGRAPPADPVRALMEQTLNDLAGLLIRALPTFLLVIALHFYLKYMFFKPMERVMRARHDASEGARKAAGDSAEKAERVAAEFEQSMRAARASLYAEQEARRKQTRAEQAAAIRDARKHAQGRVREEQEGLAREVERAKESIERESESLAAQITAAILRGRAA